MLLQKKIKPKKRDTYRKNKYKGKAYTSPYTKKDVDAKVLKSRCKGESCKRLGRQCNEITNDGRKNIFVTFNQLGCLQKQREYINQYITTKDTKTKTSKNENSRRSRTVCYFLPKNGAAVQVCKLLFLNTLSVSDKSVRTALAKKTETGITERDKRGGRPQSQVERDAVIKDLVTQHINRFPRVESHYCRKDTTREYLHSDLTKRKMFAMFKQEHERTVIPMISYEFYRKMVKAMKLSIHKPKKDMCSLCLNYLKGDKDKKAELEERYKTHIEEKTAVREKKKEAKQFADSKTVAVVFDLQQTIYMPRCNDCQIFYKRRLSTFNFTIYNLKTKECDCYVWHEGISSKGSCEVATCLYKFLTELDKDGVEEVHLFSDGTVSQNKNSIIAAMLLFKVVKSKHLKIITLKFFEAYHGQSEGDSAHSTISTALKCAGDLYHPSQLIPVFKLARLGQPYTVHSLSWTDFLNFQDTSRTLRILSVRKDDNGESLDWTKFKELMVLKAQPNKIFFKIKHTNPVYRSITLSSRTVNGLNYNPPQLHLQPPKISPLKYKDLMKLCDGELPVIRDPDAVQFYRNLPH